MRKMLHILIVLSVIVLLGSCSANSKDTVESESSSLTGFDRSANILVKKPVADEELALYSPEMRRIYDQGELRVAMVSNERTPFFYQDSNGNLIGHDVDLATDMADKFGVRIRFIRTAKSFDEVVDQVVNGQVDVAVSKLSATLSRAKKVSFSNPYMTLHQGVLINRLALAKIGTGHQNPLGLLQKSRSAIGVIAGTSYVEYAKEWFPSAEVVSFQSIDEAMDAALEGDISAIFYDELQLKQLIKSNPGHNIDLQLQLIPERVDPLAIAVSSKEPVLLAWINLYLESNRAWISGLSMKYDIQLSDSSNVKNK